MKFKYDKETDTLVISLNSKKPDFAEQNGNIITHYNKNRKATEIEILHAKKTTQKMVKSLQTQFAK